MYEISYNRQSAISYARRWAFDVNPVYYDFGNLGGDCTNFVSQSIFAGIGVMNYTRDYGWYYISPSDRSPSWTGAEYLHKFLLGNESVGPYGELVSQNEVLPGDIVQLENREGRIYHSLMITQTEPEILVTAHSRDVLDRPLDSYNFYNAYFIHILGGRRW